ncbi:glycosyltransferase, partial [Candidatus Parcubacteria bacterium]|nr:glycosyltransferase [Candidatus Parcubacteria bacterium]
KNNSKIIFKGKIPNSELSAFFSQADILIMPSLCYENSPTVISESFSCGLPVLAAKIGGSAELIEEGENGYTFIAGDKNDLTQKMKYCIRNKNKIYQLRKKALETASALSVDEYITKLLFEFNKK